MPDLVTLEDARLHLRVDSVDDDPWLLMMIPAVSDAVKAWLKDAWRPYEVERDAQGNIVLGEDGQPILMLDGEENPIVLQRVRAAVLIELMQHFRYRDGSDAAQAPAHWGHGYVLGAGATSLLNASRKSTVV